MPKDKGILGKIINAAVFILLEIAALYLLYHNSSVQNLYISQQVHSVSGFVWGGVNSVKNYFNLRKENDRLYLENYELRQKLVSLEHLEEGIKLEAISSSYPQVGNFKYMPAKIAKISKGKSHNYLIIEQGLKDGVKTQSGIITPKGVLGIVDAVGENYSYAISFMNPGISVSARLGKDGAVGSLEWDGINAKGAVLKEISLQNVFEKGDTVYTSGFSSIFPPDIPLGTTGESSIVNGATYEISVDLFVDYNSARYVTLVYNKGRDEIAELEKKEGGV